MVRSKIVGREVQGDLVDLSKEVHVAKKSAVDTSSAGRSRCALELFLWSHSSLCAVLFRNLLHFTFSYLIEDY